MVYEFDTLTNEVVGEYKSVWYAYLESGNWSSHGTAWNAYKNRYNRKYYKADVYLSDKPIPHTVYEYNGVRYINRYRAIKDNHLPRSTKDIKEVEVC